MPRKKPPKIGPVLFFHKASGQWCAKFNRKFVYFGKNQEAAADLYRRELSDRLAGRDLQRRVLRGLADFISGKKKLTDSHQRWTRACWRLWYPPPDPEAKRARKPVPKISARPLCGSGGCEGSLDYGSQFLRAGIEHFSGRWVEDARSPSPTGDWTLGGLGFGSTGYFYAPLDILLLFEGVSAFGAPWPLYVDLLAVPALFSAHDWLLSWVGQALLCAALPRRRG